MRLTLIIMALIASAQAQTIHFSPVSQSTILERSRKVPTTGSQRQEKLKDLFADAGCEGSAMTEQKVSQLPSANVICRLPGKSDETIVIAANYSAVPPDNWNAASLLPSIYQALSISRRHHTIVFVAFAGEDRTQAGAEFFAGHLTANEIMHTEAVVNLDVLGFSPTKIWTTHSDKQLVKALMTVVYALKLPASQVDIEPLGSPANQAFDGSNIPSITIHSLTHDDVALLHDGDRAAVQRFRPGNYYDSYRLISGFLAYLDETLKPRQPVK